MLKYRVICDGCGAELSSIHETHAGAAKALRERVRAEGWITQPISVRSPAWMPVSLHVDPQAFLREMESAVARRDLCPRCQRRSRRPANARIESIR